MSSSIVVLIPAYRPSVELIDLVKNLLAAGLDRIVLVDDGSPAADETIFAGVRQLPGVSYLHHPVNVGKGAALKSGFKFVHEHHPDAIGVVTADADGQHAVEDIAKVAHSLINYPDRLILGVRNFSDKLPWRSWFGNALTRWIFALLTGTKLTDTQTGLRGIPIGFLPTLVNLPGTGYEYEISMLITATRNTLGMTEVPISTIYKSHNASSHFRPITDSLRIYAVLLSYPLTSLATAIIDNIVFFLAFSLSSNIAVSQVIGRLSALTFNYFVLKTMVFDSRQQHIKTFPKYVGLVGVSGLFAYALISLMTLKLGLAVVPAKLIAELLLFFVNFFVFRDMVFPRSSGRYLPTKLIIIPPGYLKSIAAVSDRMPRVYCNPIKIVRDFFWLRFSVLAELADRYVAKYDRCLDFGCGSGIFLPTLSKMFCEVVGIDLEMTEATRLVGDYHLNNVQLIEQDITATQLDDQFDAIFAADVLEHFSDLKLPVDKIKLWLKPDGSLLTSLPAENFFTRITRIVEGHRKPWDHYHTGREVEDFLSSQGFVRVAKRIVVPLYPLYPISVWRRS